MSKQKLITILAIIAIIAGSISTYLMEEEIPVVETVPVDRSGIDSIFVTKDAVMTTDTIIIADTIK